jgi:two-component system nitrogen regulation response regulator GlnG
MSKVIVIDDDRSIRRIVESGLTQIGIDVLCAEDGESALRLIEAEAPQVALVDIMMPNISGLELFHKIRAFDTRVPIIFITSDTSSQTAIEAMRMGAFDYVAKPINIPQLQSLVSSAIESRKLMDQPVALAVGGGDASGERFIGRSTAMLEVFKAVGRVASQKVTVLVRGESGCGKELVARALYEHSDRSDKPFVAVNCAAIPDQLLESELFGYEKGAFTGADKRRIGRFEQCDGGTLFLDEVGDMSPLIQGKVLRVLQEQTFERVGGNQQLKSDVRIIAATNRPLEQMVEDDEFREDLFYRLNGFTIHLPPLRNRTDDIPLLLEYFLRRAKSEMNKQDLDGIAPDALELLKAYSWPGNIRQLQSVVRQSVLNVTGTVLAADSLPEFVRIGGEEEIVRANPKRRFGNAATAGQSLSDRQSAEDGYAASLSSEMVGDEEVITLPQNGVTDSIAAVIDERLVSGSENVYDEVLEIVERQLFTRVLQNTGGNQSKASTILGITRGKVRDRIAAFNIQVDKTVSVGG